MPAAKKVKTATKPKTEELKVTPETTANLPTISNPAQPFLTLLEKIAFDPRANIEKMRAVLDMQKEMVAEERRIAFSIAMLQAQRKMDPVVKADKGENSKYAKLERIDAAIRPHYIEAGFTLSFNSKKTGDRSYIVYCSCFQEGGHTEKYELEGNIDDMGPKGAKNKTDVQGLGSLVSYLRRYLTCMIFNVAVIDEDNDGSGRPIDVKPKASFNDLVKQSASAKVSDAQFEDVKASAAVESEEEDDDKPWDGKTIALLDGSVIGGKWKTAFDAGRDLLKAMKVFPDKKSRGAVLDKNLDVLRAIVAEGKQVAAQELRNFADLGE